MDIKTKPGKVRTQTRDLRRKRQSQTLNLKKMLTSLLSNNTGSTKRLGNEKASQRTRKPRGKKKETANNGGKNPSDGCTIKGDEGKLSSSINKGAEERLEGGREGGRTLVWRRGDSHRRGKENRNQEISAK